MPREHWNNLAGRFGQPVAFDVRSTPMADVANVSSVVVTVAHEFGPATTRVSVFRDDPDDAPNRINLDDYDVWTDLSAHPRLPDMITAASTSDNENLRTFCRDNVFFVKRDHGPDHWMPTLPASISLILRST